MNDQLAEGHIKDLYDYLIVGGGPAGCAFAASLITRGVAADSILVVDKDNFPRDKICGDGWTHNAIPLVREMFPELRSSLPSESFVTTMEVHFLAINQAQRVVQNTDVVPRRKLDLALWTAIQERGIHTLEGARVRQLIFEETRVTGARIDTSDGRREIRCRLLVGADGSAGTVRKATGSLAGDRRIHAVRQYVKGLSQPFSELKFFLDHENQGYFWAFPFIEDGRGCANIGYISFRQGASNLIPRFRELKQSDAVKNCIGPWDEEGPAKAFPLNIAPPGLFRRLMVRPPWGDGYILLGDAAALVAPYSGEGIAFALWSGQIAAQTLDLEQLEQAAWQRRYERRIRRILRWHHDRIMGVMLMEVPWRIGPRATAVLLRVVLRLGRILLMIKPEIGSGRAIEKCGP